MRQKHKLCSQCRFYKNDKCEERGIGTASWKWACTLFQVKKAKIGLCECGSNRRYGFAGMKKPRKRGAGLGDDQREAVKWDADTSD